MLKNSPEIEQLTQILCPYKRAISILGNKWILMILKELFLGGGVLRFGQLKNQLSPISSKTLSTKLKKLVKYQMVNRKVFPSVPVTVEYSLNERTYDLEKILDLMAEWSSKWYPAVEN